MAEPQTVVAARQFLLERSRQGRVPSVEAVQSVQNLNPVFAVRMASLIRAGEAATGERADITESWRNNATQAQYYANAKGTFTYQGVTYKPERRSPGAVAYPGRSKHQRGDAIDVSHTASPKVWAWMQEHDKDFGIHQIGNFDKPHFQIDPRVAMNDAEIQIALGATGEASVEDFQRKHDLTVDGVVGPQTFRAFNDVMTATAKAAAKEGQPFTVYRDGFGRNNKPTPLPPGMTMQVALADPAAVKAATGVATGVAASEIPPEAVEGANRTYANLWGREPFAKPDASAGFNVADLRQAIGTPNAPEISPIAYAAGAGGPDPFAAVLAGNQPRETLVGGNMPLPRPRPPEQLNPFSSPYSVRGAEQGVGAPDAGSVPLPLTSPLRDLIPPTNPRRARMDSGFPGGQYGDFGMMPTPRERPIPIPGSDPMYAGSVPAPRMRPPPDAVTDYPDYVRNPDIGMGDVVPPVNPRTMGPPAGLTNSAILDRLRNRPPTERGTPGAIMMPRPAAPSAMDEFQRRFSEGEFKTQEEFWGALEDMGLHVIGNDEVMRMMNPNETLPGRAALEPSPPPSPVMTPVRPDFGVPYYERLTTAPAPSGPFPPGPFPPRPELDAAGMPAAPQETPEQAQARMQAELAGFLGGMNERAGTPYGPNFDAANPGPQLDLTGRPPTQGAVFDPSMAPAPMTRPVLPNDILAGSQHDGGMVTPRPTMANQDGRFADAFGPPTHVLPPQQTARGGFSGFLTGVNDFMFGGEPTGISDFANWLDGGPTGPASAAIPPNPNPGFPGGPLPGGSIYNDRVPDGEWFSPDPAMMPQSRGWGERQGVYERPDTMSFRNPTGSIPAGAVQTADASSAISGWSAAPPSDLGLTVPASPALPGRSSGPYDYNPVVAAPVNVPVPSLSSTPVGWQPATSDPFNITPPVVAAPVTPTVPVAPPPQSAPSTYTPPPQPRRFAPVQNMMQRRADRMARIAEVAGNIGDRIFGGGGPVFSGFGSGRVFSPMGGSGPGPFGGTFGGAFTGGGSSGSSGWNPAPGPFSGGTADPYNNVRSWT